MSDRALESRARPRRRLRRLPKPPQGAHRCMVLAHGPDDVAVVELGSGGVARLRTDGSIPENGPAPLDLVDAVWARDPERDDLAQPEAVTVERAPEVVGLMGRRAAKRLLRRLVTPPGQNLLGFSGNSAPYWEFGGTHPSVAVVVPSRGPLLSRRDGEDPVWARFGWPGNDNLLPVDDPVVVSAVCSSDQEELWGQQLARALGYKPHYLVATVSRPRDGRCYKTVAALLPRL